MNITKETFDNDNKISVHSENIDGFNVFTLSEVKKASMHIVYGLTEVASNGFFNGQESRTTLFTSEKECLDAAYECYCEAWRKLEKEGLIVGGSGENLVALLSKAQFTKTLMDRNYVVIKLRGSHVQFEHFSQELVFPERQITNDKKPSLAEKIKHASSLVEGGNEKSQPYDLTR